MHISDSTPAQTSVLDSNIKKSWRRFLCQDFLSKKESSFSFLRIYRTKRTTGCRSSLPKSIMRGEDFYKN
ncbi:hypothetical protein B5E53_06255 [Eubacterium sp. An11]|nr:hypothetical protein B5E53_06255 [Eubacterium sp. An11]